jgi:catechol 2,3-dioxygenase-like lactoylglutathione lyase family enzyme
MDRRTFLTRVGAAAGLLVAHRALPAAEPDPKKGSMDTAPRIASLELLTAAPLAEMTRFYRDTIGLRVLDEKKDRVTIAGGATSVTFVAAGADAGKPFYHFAFNIPENKIRAARDWQRERTPLIPVPERLRDPEYPDDIVDYSHWNAHSVFFFDPAENVVEYIARHDLSNAAPGGFDTSDILYASEIAFVVDDVPQAAGVLRGVASVPQYRGGDEQFAALGDEHGLLLVFHRGRVISLASERTKAADVFPVVARVRGAASAKPVLPSYPYTIVAG